MRLVLAKLRAMIMYGRNPRSLIRLVGCRGEQVCREPMGDLSLDKTPLAPLTKGGNYHGGEQGELRADDQVWMNLGEFELFGWLSS
jgi:hypothetical protein